MNRQAGNPQLDPAIEAFFAQRGMTHISRQVPTSGALPILGHITLDGYASADGLWFALPVPSPGVHHQISISWQLMRAVPGVESPEDRG